jgi:hypothetical protein
MSRSEKNCGSCEHQDLGKDSMGNFKVPCSICLGCPGKYIMYQAKRSPWEIISEEIRNEIYISNQKSKTNLEVAIVK